ncbi:hypothetical protein NLJ89_g6464 [Agrocybe chaxingu]|uniref:Ricin B lectin domain-containing protein n=1 Tax=Agrocybe chaxingu TaxID=84603 RepID=A0A9W8K0R0_9AGAR|nr:hypothetical protein NLJ89_g6464 [Agrocybe chaxingu]
MFSSEGVYWIRNKDLSTKSIDLVKQPYVHGGEQTSLPVGILSARLVRAQLWIVEQVPDGESFVIRNFDTGTVLDIQGQSSAEGTPIVVSSYSDVQESSSSLHWKIIWDSDENNVPFYRITNQKVGTVLDQTTNNKNGAAYAIESWKPNGTAHQLWSFERVIFPTMYWVMNINNPGIVLEWQPSTSNDAGLNEKAKQTERYQLWYLEETQDHQDYHTIRNVQYEDKVVDLSGDDDRTIKGWNATGNANQRWALTDVNFNGVVNVICAKNDTVLYEDHQREIVVPRGASDPDTFSKTCNWRLVPCPTPSLFWTTLQCKESGKFVSQADNGSVISSNGSRGERDRSGQWRFIFQGRNAYFTVVNHKNPNNSKYYWTLDGAGSDISVTNLSSSNVISYVNGNIKALSGGATDTTRHYVAVTDSSSFPYLQTIQSVPSFAIINGRTGMALAFVPGATQQSVLTDSTFNSYRCQWIFQQVGLDSEDRPTFAIINKLSDNVLDHWGGTAIEALNDDPNDPHHRWRVAAVPQERDPDGVDTISLDTDLSEPYQNSHLVVKRSPGGKKGKGKTKSNPDHIPTNARITQVDEPVIAEIFGRLINEWAEDQLPSDTRARQYASTDRTEVQQRWHIQLPRALAVGSDRDGWIRIDIQGAYNESPGVRVANVQGQWGTRTVFHVVIPVGIRIGREIIRQAMRRSLKRELPNRIDRPRPTPRRAGPRTSPPPRQSHLVPGRRRQANSGLALV